MRKVVTLIILALVSIQINAQMPDLHDRIVTKNGNTYKATFNHKSNNGGTASEIWTGQLVNGKREGVWKFTGTYNKYMVSNNKFQSGTATMIRTYKNGVLNGAYTINYNLQSILGTYNVFTDKWIYQTPTPVKERLEGSFVSGKANGTWKISSTASMETVQIYFKNGLVDGELSLNQQFPELKTYATFEDGYLTYMKTTNPDNWGYETKYGDKNPREIYPQQTIEVNDFLNYWKYYLNGLALTTLYIKEYPKNSSDESVVAKYIVPDYDTYCTTWGNVPAYVLAVIEDNRNIKINDRLDKRYDVISEQIDSLYRQHYNTLSKEFNHFLSNFALEHLYKEEYVNKIIFAEHPEFVAFIDTVKNSTNSRLQSTLERLRIFNYDANDRNNYQNKFNNLYTSALHEIKQHHGTKSDLDTTLFIKIYPTKRRVSGIGRNEELSLWDKYLQDLDERYVLETFQLTESDLLHYLAWRYGDYSISYSTNVYGSVTCKLTSKTAYSVTENLVRAFALKYTDNNGKRQYKKCLMPPDNRRNISVVDVLDNLKDTKAFKKLRATVQF